MARPKSDMPIRAQVSLKMDQELIEEISRIAEILYSDKSKILHKCIELGLERFKCVEKDLIERRLIEHKKFSPNIGHDEEKKRSKAA